MKVLHLGKYYHPEVGGIETVLFDIVETLNQNGIQADVLCFSSGYIYSEEMVKNYKVIRVKTLCKLFSTPLSWQLIWKLRGEIGQYDIVHIHLPNPMMNLALFLANIADTKIIVHWHSDIVKQRRLLRVYEPLQRWLLNAAAKIIGTSPTYVEHSVHLSQYKSKCAVIPIGIDRVRLPTAFGKTAAIRERYQGKKIIFALGRLTYYKGFQYLIESAKFLNDDFIVLIGGDGELRGELELVIERNRLQNMVVLLGKIADGELGNYYEACDIFCLPSIEKSEAFGVVLVEAMSFGKPIVATKIAGSGVEWVNEHGVTGLNVEVRSPEKLSVAFRTILESKAVYDKFASNSFKRFSRLFVKEAMVSQVISLYDNVLVDDVFE